MRLHSLRLRALEFYWFSQFRSLVSCLLSILLVDTLNSVSLPNRIHSIIVFRQFFSESLLCYSAYAYHIAVSQKLAVFCVFLCILKEFSMYLSTY